MRKLNFIFIILIISCGRNENSEIRKPFDLNRNLTVDILLDNGYEQLFGDDIYLFGKKIDNINVYYQIDLPEQTEEIANELGFLKLLRDKGVITFKNYQKEVKEEEYSYLKDTINQKRFKVIKLEKGNYVNIKDRFRVVNLKSKDTFNCELTKKNNKLIFNSYIIIE